jgi:hypothetical protein
MLNIYVLSKVLFMQTDLHFQSHTEKYLLAIGGHKIVCHSFQSPMNIELPWFMEKGFSFAATNLELGY